MDCNNNLPTIEESFGCVLELQRDVPYKPYPNPLPFPARPLWRDPRVVAKPRQQQALPLSEGRQPHQRKNSLWKNSNKIFDLQINNDINARSIFSNLSVNVENDKNLIESPQSCVPSVDSSANQMMDTNRSLLLNEWSNDYTNVFQEVNHLYSDLHPIERECVLCKNNGKDPKVYKSHFMKDRYGKVVCPHLINYNCPLCNNRGGPEAHTMRYCPIYKVKVRQIFDFKSKY